MGKYAKNISIIVWNQCKNSAIVDIWSILNVWLKKLIFSLYSMFLLEKAAISWHKLLYFVILLWTSDYIFYSKTKKESFDGFSSLSEENVDISILSL